MKDELEQETRKFGRERMGMEDVDIRRAPGEVIVAVVGSGKSRSSSQTDFQDFGLGRRLIPSFFLLGGSRLLGPD